MNAYRHTSCHLLQVRIDLIINLNHDFFPVVFAPVSLFIHVSHDLTLLIGCINLLDIHTVHLHQVLFQFWLAQEIVDSEVDPLLSVVLRRTHKLHLMIDEIDFTLWFAEVTGDRWLESLGVHVVFVLKSLLIV